MKIVMDRGYCNASGQFCSRCSAAFFRKPLGTDRPCVVAVEDDGNDELIEFEILSEGRTLQFVLTDENREGLSLEGWEFLADFHSAYLREGAADRWRDLGNVPHAHG